MAKGNRRSEHVDLQLPQKLQSCQERGPGMDSVTMKHELEGDSVTMPRGPARHADVFKVQTSAGQKWKKEEERVRERDKGRRGGKRKRRKNKGKEQLTFGAWLSFQPRSPGGAPLAFFSQGSCADHLDYRM